MIATKCITLEKRFNNDVLVCTMNLELEMGKHGNGDCFHIGHNQIEDHAVVLDLLDTPKEEEHCCVPYGRGSA